MAYSKNLTENIEKICTYYEAHDGIEFLRRIMAFVSDCINLIDEAELLLSKSEISALCTRARAQWQKDGSPEKLSIIAIEYQNKVFSKTTIKEIIQSKRKYAAFQAIGCYFSNMHDEPTNQFVYDFPELFVDALCILDIKEQQLNALVSRHFKDIC